METTAYVYLAAGVAALLAALLPRLLSRVPVSPPMVFLGLGIIGYTLASDAPVPDPIDYRGYTEHLAELTVIVSLMGAGLALDRPFGRRNWQSTWRLLAITMPLSIGVVALLGWWALGLAPAAAMLLGAALAPTDPVLASEVQVGEPTTEGRGVEAEDEPRFALTSEAGLNDGLAFPFVYVAVAMATAGVAPSGWFAGWLAYDVVYRLAAGVVVGLVVGWALAQLFFSAPLRSLRLAEAAEGFVALACTLLTYGVSELVHGYGFVSVFVCAVTIRGAERAHGYHRVLHGYIEQLERLLTALILVLLGGAVARGLLTVLAWTDILLALALLLVVRPLTGFVALLGTRTTGPERAFVSFFGIRGIGSIYYIAFASSEARFPGMDRLFAIVGLVVVLSVALHGLTATPASRALGLRRPRATDAR